MNQPKKLKAGFIGCGSIAHFHADVLKHIGADIAALSYRSNLEKAESFAKKYGIKRIFNGWHEMIKEAELDFVWILPAWDQIDIMCEEIIETGIPAFFEKPLALSSDKTARVLEKYPAEYLNRYQVGYNRRYYKVVSELKDFLTTEKISAIHIDIPEPIKGIDENLLKHRLVQNSAHMFDLLFYLIGSYNTTEHNFIRLFTQKSRNDFVGTLKLNDIPISFTSVWNSPQNYSMKIYTESEKVYQLSPFEALNVFEGFDVIDPTREVPIRRYLPKVKLSRFEISENKFKPGFLEQAADFVENIFRSRKSRIAHSIDDSNKLLNFLEKITP